MSEQRTPKVKTEKEMDAVNRPRCLPHHRRILEHPDWRGSSVDFSTFDAKTRTNGNRRRNPRSPGSSDLVHFPRCRTSSKGGQCLSRLVSMQLPRRVKFISAPSRHAPGSQRRVGDMIQIEESRLTW
jgi:hypothetical protein